MSEIMIESEQSVLPKITRPVTFYSEESEGHSSQIDSAMLPLKGPVKNHSFSWENRQFICGWGAAFINITVTFPLNKLMFRQMLHGISTTRALNQLRREGLKMLYRGILPPLCQKTVSTSIMFGMYEKYKQILQAHCPSLSSSRTLVLSAALSGCTEAILCPFERIQTILQDKKFHGMYKNTVHCAKELRQYGFPEYFRGMNLILMRNAFSNVLFFGLRAEIKTALPQTRDVWSETVLDFISGAALGAFISTVVYPANVVKAHQQSQVGGSFVSIYDTFRDVYESRGRKMSKLFKGVHVNYTRALVSWGIINASYEVLLKTFEQQQSRDS